MGFPHSNLWLDPSSRGSDHSHVPGPQRHRYPARTTANRASQGPQTMTQLGSANVPRHNRALSVIDVNKIHLAWSSNTPSPNQSTQLVSNPNSRPGSSGNASAPSSCGRMAIHALVQLETIDTRWMGCEHGIRIQTGAEKPSNTTLRDSTNLPSTSDQCNERGNIHIAGQRCNYTSQRRGQREREKGFYSAVFLVPKRDGKWRPVINLRELNRFIRTAHFKMEDIQSVRDLLLESDWLTRIDLKDAYFSVPVHTDRQKFLRFRWQNTSYQFICLPFGLSMAPRVFTKLLKPAMTYLRSKGVCSVIYIDDILFMARTEEEARDNTAMTLNLQEALG